MGGPDSYSEDLDAAAKVLFPTLSPAERRARIEAVLARAADEGELDRIERAAGPDLVTLLMSLVRETAADDSE